MCPHSALKTCWPDTSWRLFIAQSRLPRAAPLGHLFRHLQFPANLLVVILLVELYKPGSGKSSRIFPRARQPYPHASQAPRLQPGGYDFLRVLGPALATGGGWAADHGSDSAADMRGVRHSHGAPCAWARQARTQRCTARKAYAGQAAKRMNAVLGTGFCRLATRKRPVGPRVACRQWRPISARQG